MPIRRLDKTLTATTATVAGEDIAANSIPVKPHIQYGMLQPAVAGKDLSGTALGGSYTYGTAHTDGHSYYYTDIKGSKPIKDPRIGGHFGTHRHLLSSAQKLEQEIATLKAQAELLIAPEPNSDTGEVPLRTGIAAALLDKKGPQPKIVKDNKKKLKMSLGKSKIKVDPDVPIGQISGGIQTGTGNLH